MRTGGIARHPWIAYPASGHSQLSKSPKVSRGQPVPGEEMHNAPQPSCVRRTPHLPQPPSFLVPLGLVSRLRSSLSPWALTASAIECTATLSPGFYPVHALKHCALLNPSMPCWSIGLRTSKWNQASSLRKFSAAATNSSNVISAITTCTVSHHHLEPDL